MLSYALSIFLQVLILLVLVPNVTGGGVAVRQGGLIRGLITVLFIGLVNVGLWVGLAMLTLGTALAVQVVTFGLLGIIVNALAIRVVGGILPDVLYVRNFGSAFSAAVVITICNFLIGYLL
ncbi:MAG: phage holin family protein [Cyanobacteria bacterium HKST-UBA02]|nr:phage holin family protein [Cyanobacteria bacterium HKST-UBA02]